MVGYVYVKHIPVRKNGFSCEDNNNHKEKQEKTAVRYKNIHTRHLPENYTQNTHPQKETHRSGRKCKDTMDVNMRMFRTL